MNRELNKELYKVLLSYLDTLKIDVYHDTTAIKMDLKDIMLFCKRWLEELER